MNKALLMCAFVLATFVGGTAFASEQFDLPLTAASVTAGEGEGATTVSISVVQPDKAGMPWRIGSMKIDHAGKRFEVPATTFSDVAGADLNSIRLAISGSMDGGGPFLIVKMRVLSPNFGDADIKTPIYLGLMIRDEKVHSRFIQRNRGGGDHTEFLRPSERQ